MKPIREIKNKKGELHFRRWCLFGSKFFSVYIHGIYKEDQDEHLHNHPWNMLSIIIKGSYSEELLNKAGNMRRISTRNRGSFAYRNYKRFHKVKKIFNGPVYTLVLVGRRKNNNWGYNVKGVFVDNVKYRMIKNMKNFLEIYKMK